MTTPAAADRVRWGRWVALVLVALVVIAAWLGLRGMQAKKHLDTARAQLSTAQSALGDRDIPAASAAITAAGRETAKARSETGDPIWWAVGKIPWLGNTVRTSRGIAVTADDTARRVLPDALDAARLLDPARLRHPGGVVDMSLVTQAAPALARSAARERAVRADVHALPTSLTPAAVSRALADLTTQSDKLSTALDAAATATKIAPALLGADRPRRYFVLLQQTGESRGTGGIPGGFAILRAAGGRLTVERQGSNAELKGGAVTPPASLPPDFVKRYDALGAFAIWPNVNLSPDLPMVARIVAARWRAQSGQPIDGVITMDALALTDLLRGSGPIDVGGGQAVAPADLPQFLSVGQYVGVVEGGPNDRRKERLSQIAERAVQRLTGGEGSTNDMLRGLADAVRSGHIRMASDDPALAPTLRDSGVDGALPTGSAPVAYPVVFNTASGKLDSFLDRSVRYEARGCSGRTRSSTITVTLRSTPPPQLPPYVTILDVNGKITSSRTNSLAVEVYGTRGATLRSATLDGAPVQGLETAHEAGLPVWMSFVDLPPGKARVLTLRLTEPVVAGEARVPEQPLARPLHKEVDVTQCDR